MTAALLLRALAPVRPAVDGAELVLAGPAPAPLGALVPVLQSGLRAALTGRPWYAYGPDGRGVGPLPDGTLDPARPVPWLACRLCVAGDGCWDICRGWWRLDFPHLFGPPPRKPPARPPTTARRCPFLPLGQGVADTPSSAE